MQVSLTHIRRAQDSTVLPRQSPRPSLSIAVVGRRRDQLSCSHALRAGSPASPTTGSALVCFLDEVQVYDEGWGQEG